MSRRSRVSAIRCRATTTSTWAPPTQVTKQITARVGVNNVADKDPPIIQAFYGASVLDSGNTYPETYDWGGRYSVREHHRGLLDTGTTNVDSKAGFGPPFFVA